MRDSCQLNKFRKVKATASIAMLRQNQYNVWFEFRPLDHHRGTRGQYQWMLPLKDLAHPDWPSGLGKGLQWHARIGTKSALGGGSEWSGVSAY